MYVGLLTCGLTTKRLLTALTLWVNIYMGYSVRMTGCWSSYFFSVYSPESDLRSMNTKNKNEANIQPSWRNKLGQWDIYCVASASASASASGKFFLRDTTSNPERARQRHLTRSGSQTQHKIWRLLLAHEVSLTIKRCKMPTVFQTGVWSQLTIMQDACNQGK